MGSHFEYAETNYTLTDFCYKPISGKDCIVTSPLEYWKSNYTMLNSESEAKIKQTS